VPYFGDDDVTGIECHDIFDTVPGEHEPETINECSEVTIFYMVSKYCSRRSSASGVERNGGAMDHRAEKALDCPEVLGSLEKVLHINTQLVLNSYKKTLEAVTLRNR
jgi:hypothetical protein